MIVRFYWYLEQVPIWTDSCVRDLSIRLLPVCLSMRRLIQQICICFSKICICFLLELNSHFQWIFGLTAVVIKWNVYCPFRIYRKPKKIIAVKYISVTTTTTTSSAAATATCGDNKNGKWKKKPEPQKERKKKKHSKINRKLNSY